MLNYRVLANSGVVNIVVTIAISTSMVKSRGERTPSSRPMLRTISSTRPRVFIRMPSAELSRQGSPVNRASLAAVRLGHLWAPLQPLATLDGPMLARVLGALLEERAARPPSRVELVWTGGEAKTAYARPTASVVRELFEHAERHVLIAGYSFDHGASILAPLHARMLARGVAVTGVTVHLVDEEVDHGPIVAQTAVPVLAGDTESVLHARIQVEEHRLYPEVLADLAAGRIRVEQGRVVRAAP